MKNEIRRRMRSRKKRLIRARAQGIANKAPEITWPRTSPETAVLSMINSLMTDEASEKCRRNIRVAVSMMESDFCRPSPGLVLSATYLMLFLDFLGIVPDLVVPLPDRDEARGIQLDFGNTAEIEIRAGQHALMLFYGGPKCDDLESRAFLENMDDALELKAHLGHYSSASEMLIDRASLTSFSLRIMI